LRAILTHEARFYRSHFWVWPAVGAVGVHLNPKARYDRKYSAITPLGVGFRISRGGDALTICNFAVILPFLQPITPLLITLKRHIPLPFYD
jgi:hypothetical protein